MQQLKIAFASANESVIKWSNKHYWFTYCFGMLLMIIAYVGYFLTVNLTMWQTPNWQLVLSVMLVLGLIFCGFRFAISGLFRFLFAI